ncbi:hypothetical protein ACOJQI_10730 [Bacillus salacetis]
MFNKDVIKALMYSTILSTILSFIGIGLTIYHHKKMQKVVRESNNG